MPILVVCFCFTFSFSTSPLYDNYYAYGGAYDSGDSLQFLTIGKSWLEGEVPYRDSFDHKGHYIFLSICSDLFLAEELDMEFAKVFPLS